MKSFVIGPGCVVDIETLLRTRLLIQANSGGGKSWLLRRIAEQLFGKVQVIIIDPEGEFSTLREKYGYVLVGHGGETPADPRSAGLVAEKLLELNASAVCDLFESFRKTPQGRHTFVKNFCNAMLDAPKKLWHPVVLIIDEFHKFVPEKGAGESEASEAVIGIGTAGRKRGYCLIGATQRLGKVRKDVSAEMLNRLVGPTFEDIDLERAADLLSVMREDRKPFFAQMRVLEPGNFFALGRALARERTLVRVGKVETTHPEMGKTEWEPPPAPEKVKALLPKLIDLPKQAEEKAQTIDALKQKVRELEREKRQRPQGEATAEMVQHEVDKVRREIEKSVKVIIKQGTDYEQKVKRSVEAAVRSLQSIASVEFTFPAFKLSTPELSVVTQQPKQSIEIGDTEITQKQTERRLGRCERMILSFLSTNERKFWSMEQVAIMTKYAVAGGGFGNAVGTLSTEGLIERADGKLRLVALPEGFSPERIEYSVDGIKEVLGRCEREIIDYMLKNVEREFTLEDVAANTFQINGEPYAAGGGGFGNSIGKLTSLGFLYRSNGRIRLSDDVKELL